jgi:F-type H+-transporting ATPase subunit b
MKKALGATLLALASLAGVAVAQEQAEATAEHHQEAGPSELWKWANFALLAAGLGFLIAKNLPPLFRSRTAEIQKGISEAQQLKREAEQRAAEMDARLRALGGDIEKFRAQAQAEMQQESERIRQATAAEVQKIEEHSTHEIEAAGKAARRQLKEYAAELALDLAEQRIRTRLDPATNARVVDNFVGDLKRQGSNN